MLTKVQRKRWWNSLTEYEQTEYKLKKSHRKYREDEYAPLSYEEMVTINDNMRSIGMEKFIVLEPEVNEDIHHLRAIQHEEW